jgi:hypothetical protein
MVADADAIAFAVTGWCLACLPISLLTIRLEALHHGRVCGRAGAG